MVRAAVAVLAAACGDATGPRSGPLDVRVTGATPARAVVLRVVGPVAAVSAPPGSAVVVVAAAAGTDTTRLAVIAPRGSLLSGVIARLTVPDVSATDRYGVQVLQAAGTAYALLPTGAVGVSVARP
jgi:hypothetical protein